MAKGMSTLAMQKLATFFSDNIRRWCVCEAGWNPTTDITKVTATASTGMMTRTDTLATTIYTRATNATGISIKVASWATKSSVVGTAAYIVGYNTNAGEGTTGVHFWTTCATQPVASTANIINVSTFKIYISDVT